MNKVLIVEDNVPMNIDIQMLLSQEFDLEFDVAYDHDTAVNFLSQNTYLLIIADVFLDNTYSIFDVLEKSNNRSKIIFISSIEEKSTLDKIDLYENYIFLIKPFSLLSLQSAIKNCLKTPKSNPTSKPVLFTFNGKKIPIYASDVIYISTEGNYCIVQTNRHKVIVRDKIDDIIKRFDQSSIIRIHRQHAINFHDLSKVAFKSNEVFVNEEKFPVGRKYKKDLKDYLSQL